MIEHSDELAERAERQTNDVAVVRLEREAKGWMEQFSGLLPSPYARADHSPSIANLQGHFFSEHRGDGAHYAAAFQVDREPPLPRDSGPIL
jgi:hypothetical protein